jgi:hypothetical protein
MSGSDAKKIKNGGMKPSFQNVDKAGSEGLQPDEAIILMHFVISP